MSTIINLIASTATLFTSGCSTKTESIAPQAFVEVVPGYTHNKLTTTTVYSIDKSAINIIYNKKTRKYVETIADFPIYETTYTERVSVKNGIVSVTKEEETKKYVDREIEVPVEEDEEIDDIQAKPSKYPQTKPRQYQARANFVSYAPLPKSTKSDSIEDKGKNVFNLVVTDATIRQIERRKRYEKSKKSSDTNSNK